MERVSPIQEGKDTRPGIKEIVFDEQIIAARVQELAHKITQDYHRKDLVIAGILKGAFIFASDLIRQIRLEFMLDFISISPYSPKSKMGEAKIIKDLEEDISRKHVLLIEDIVDTGLTLNYLGGILLSRDPASLAICTLLDRPDLRLVDVPIKYVGFPVNQEFLVGYGLDYRGGFRCLPYIASVSVPVAVES